MNEYASWPPTFSSTSSVNGVGNGSCRHASFNVLKSTHILIPLPCFLSCTTIRLIHYDSSTGSMMPDSSILSISSLNFYLYMGFNIYGHCLMGLALGLSGIFISPNSPAMPFISIKVVGKRSLYSRNNYVMLSSVCSSK
jgi:hypothetical protein